MARTRAEIVISDPYRPHALSLTKGHVQVEYRKADGLAALAGRRIWVRITRELLAQCLALIEMPPGLEHAKWQVADWLNRWGMPDEEKSAKTRLLDAHAVAERLLHSASAEERSAFMDKAVAADPVWARDMLRDITGKV